MMCNPARGDVAIHIGGGDHTLRLSLEALAEIETGLGVSGFADLGNALKVLNAARLCLVLTALLRAGGADQPQALAQSAHPGAAARAVTACFKANLQ